MRIGGSGFELLLMKWTLGFCFVGVVLLFAAKILVLLKLVAMAKIAALKAWLLSPEALKELLGGIFGGAS